MWNNLPRKQWEPVALGDGGPRARTGDYDTSIAGATDIAMRAYSQQFKLLREFCLAGIDGLTDEEAAYMATLPRTSCWWKRCGELRQMGLIEATPARRKGEAGVERIVSVVTGKGMVVYQTVISKRA